MRPLLISLGIILTIVGFLFWMAPIAVGMIGDKFFLTFFLWANDYIIITMLGGFIVAVAGILIFLEGWFDDF